MRTGNDRGAGGGAGQDGREGRRGACRGARGCLQAGMHNNNAWVPHELPGDQEEEVEILGLAHPAACETSPGRSSFLLCHRMAAAAAAHHGHATS